jgi:cytoskeletal protein CcmA (bactofilin family)
MQDGRRTGPGTADASAHSARDIRTFLDPGTAVNGKLSFSTPTRIEGRLKGEVRASALLIVARGGVVHGTIWARQLVVEGEVKGQILGADRVEIQPGARVTGGIETRTLVIADGANFEGDCRMGVAASPFGQPARG